jgi:HSP20 family molecular chaperone IbpA
MAMKTLYGPDGATIEVDELGAAVEQMLREEIQPEVRDYTGASNLIETEKSCWLQVALPGVDPSSLQLRVLARKLSISGRYHVPEVQGARYLRRQLPQGSFEAAFGLPAEIDGTRAEAQYDRGILTVWLPKAAYLTPHTIKVHTVS